MITPDISLQEPAASEVAAVLIDLAKLAQRAGSASEDALSKIAHDMLACILVACHATHGAVLLVVPGESPVEQRFETSEQSEDPRILAIHGIREEDVPALLGPQMSLKHGVQQAQPTAGVSCWFTYRQSLVANQGRQLLRALLLIGWAGLESDACASAVARGQKMLPLLADTAASVIVTILQAERLDELEKVAMQQNLEQMDLLKAELLATVSHELRSPLSSVKGYAATLLRHERRLTREERHQFLLAINEGTDRLERIIERLLEMSQLETGAITLQTGPVDLSLLAREAISSAEGRLPVDFADSFTFNISLKNSNGEPAQDVPLARADARRLREALDNLLENAVKYSPEGGAITVAIRTVTVEWPLAASAGNFVGKRDDHQGTQKRRAMLELRVYDNGIGIPPEHIERIFERFYRVDMRLTREVNGPGLGLTICKFIIELHGGAIWAENVPEGGSVFCMLLPPDTAKHVKSPDF